MDTHRRTDTFHVCGIYIMFWPTAAATELDDATFPAYLTAHIACARLPSRIIDPEEVKFLNLALARYLWVQKYIPAALPAVYQKQFDQVRPHLHSRNSAQILCGPHWDPSQGHHSAKPLSLTSVACWYRVSATPGNGVL